MKIHGLLGVHGPAVTDGFKYPPVGFPGIFILCFPDRTCKHLDSVRDHGNQDVYKRQSLDLTVPKVTLMTGSGSPPCASLWKT